MIILLGIVIIVYILYKAGSTEEENKNVASKNRNVASDENLDNVKENYLTNERIIKISSELMNVPYVDTNSRNVKELAGKLLKQPLEIEKLVGTVIILEDIVRDAYVKYGNTYIVLGSGEHLNTYVWEQYICEMEGFEDVVERLNIGYSRVKVVGILDREHENLRQPNLLKRAMIVEIDFSDVPAAVLYFEKMGKFLSI